MLNRLEVNQFMLSAPLFTIQEVSELLKVSEATVRSWIKNQELRAIKFEREFRVAKVDLESFLDSKATIKKAE
jgi:excisionase family DNA binding protein